MTEHYRHPQSIVSADWLREHLHDDALRVFECTTYLDPPTAESDAPYTVRPGRADFDAGHVPGAGFLDLQGELSDASGPSHLRFTMPSAEALAEAFGARGIGDSSRVVLYSRVNMQWATRVWWMLRAIGFDHAAILDGGFEHWCATGGGLSTDACEYASAQLSARPRSGLFADRAEMQAAIGNAGICTINALSPELHRGDSDRYGRPGRIPGSVNLPAAALSDPQSKLFVSPEAAAQHFAAIGAHKDGRNLVYCGGGIAATLDAFLMHQLGYENIAVYDASMSEWARDESLPIETG